MPAIEDLMRRNLLEVFGQRDETLRRAAIAELHTDDIEFADHDGSVVGRDAVSAKIQALHDRTPGFVFADSGPFYEVQDLGTLGWSYGPAGAAAVVTGTDVVLVQDGRVAKLWVYLTS